MSTARRTGQIGPTPLLKQGVGYANFIRDPAGLGCRGETADLETRLGWQFHPHTLTIRRYNTRRNSQHV